MPRKVKFLWRPLLLATALCCILSIMTLGGAELVVDIEYSHKRQKMAKSLQRARKKALDKMPDHGGRVLSKEETRKKEARVFGGNARHALKRKEIGGRCSDTEIDCNIDLYCSKKTRKCVRKAREGHICEEDEHCQKDLVCGADSVCTKLHGDIGSYCHDTTDCADNLVCSEKLHKCAVKCRVDLSAKDNNSPDCDSKQECVDGVCVGMNYGSCLPVCGKGLQCNRLTNKCRPKTSQMPKCDDFHKMKCVKECLAIEPHNPDRTVYCGWCCINNCRCFNGPGWFKLVPKYFLDIAIGPYKIEYATNRNLTHN